MLLNKICTPHRSRSLYVGPSKPGCRSLGIHDRSRKNADKKGPRSEAAREKREETTLTAEALFTLDSALHLSARPHRARPLSFYVLLQRDAATDGATRQSSRMLSERMIAMPPSNMFEWKVIRVEVDVVNFPAAQPVSQ